MCKFIEGLDKLVNNEYNYLIIEKIYKSDFNTYDKSTNVLYCNNKPIYIINSSLPSNTNLKGKWFNEGYNSTLLFDGNKDVDFYTGSINTDVYSLSKYENTLLNCSYSTSDGWIIINDISLGKSIINGKITMDWYEGKTYLILYDLNNNKKIFDFIHE